MPRKKTTARADAKAHGAADARDEIKADAINETHAATAVAEPPTARAAETPSWIDGPDVPLPETQPKKWGEPYKTIFSGHDFELGEHRRFKQRVFRFLDKPSPERLTSLKDAGFIYRAAEKAWTIPADVETRKLSDDLARQFAGSGAGMSR